MFRNPFFMLKRTHRREFTKLSQTYLKEMEIAQRAEYAAVSKLRVETTRYANLLNDLTSYEDKWGTHELESIVKEGSPQNFPSKMVRVHKHYATDTTIFYFHITNFLLNRAMYVFGAHSGAYARELDDMTKLIRHNIEAAIYEHLIKELGRG